MEHETTYWKSLSLNLLFAFQVLFLATATWDFFLTAVISNSHRALVFSQLGAISTGLIVVPWLASLFVLSIMLIVFLINKEKNQPILTTRVHYEYGVFSIIYLVLAISATTNPLVGWPVVLNYIVNFFWSIILIYFRIKTKEGPK